MILYRIADKIIFNILKKLNVGYLEITSTTGELLRFGNYNDKLKADLKIKSPALSYNLIKGGSVGLAECYMKNEFETSNLSNLIELAARNINIIHKFAGILDLKFLNFIKNKFIKNTKSRSKENIAKHYDLGNDFYELMLDPTMTYSCGIFNSPECTLEEASLAKYDRIIDQLDIQPHHHVLEIGCGWGGFAHRLAERTEAKLTATTISERQYEYAQNRIQKAGFHDRISIVKQDYRDLTGHFDRVVSIEMIEAVGHEFLPTYFSQISDLLVSDGAAMIQGITMPDHRYTQYLKEVDYIRTRVFPGSCVPSASAMIEAAVRKSDLRPADLHDFGYHYSRTLREWRMRFLENEEEIKKLGYDDHFRRAWLYYLCYCEAGFEEGYTGDIHLLLAKPASKLSRGFPQ